MRVLCEEGGWLLGDLFDGLLWTAKSASTTEDGGIRVNYYVTRARARMHARARKRAHRHTACVNGGG